jgi:hypothetical protein
MTMFQNDSEQRYVQQQCCRDWGVINLKLFLKAQIFSYAFCLHAVAMLEVINGHGNWHICRLVTNILSSSGDWLQIY